MQPDRRKLDRMLTTVMQLRGKCFLLPDFLGQSIDYVSRGGQNAEGCGVILPGESYLAIIAVVVRAKQHHNVGSPNPVGGTPPDSGIDGASAHIVDMRTDQAA